MEQTTDSQEYNYDPVVIGEFEQFKAQMLMTFNAHELSIRQLASSLQELQKKYAGLKAYCDGLECELSIWKQQTEIMDQEVKELNKNHNQKERAGQITKKVK